jgi:hypothetical protein
MNMANRKESIFQTQTAGNEAYIAMNWTALEPQMCVPFENRNAFSSIRHHHLSVGYSGPQ